MRLQLCVAYDGRPFQGWQIQPQAETVQAHLEQALSETAKQIVRVHGAGRTDSGVHAWGQVAHFDAPAGLSMNPYNWVPALNSKLPPSIRVRSCQEVSADFHARFSAQEKTYCYDLSLDPILPPLRAGLTWHLPRQLDPVSLQEALQLFVGEHNFQSFAAKRGNENKETNYVRCIQEASCQETEEGYRLTYRGNGFLYKMVRLLTGAAVHVAQARLFFLDDLKSLLKHPSEEVKSPLCAPPDGLTLMKVSY